MNKRDYSILDDIENGIQIIDPDLRYVYLNHVLLNEINMTADEVVGFHMTEKFPGIDQTEVYKEILKCFRDGTSSKLLNEFKFPDGRITYYELQIQRIEEGVIIFSRDITETKQGEILLQETNKSLNQFVHIAAHDMREPVKRIVVLSEQLLLDSAKMEPEEIGQISERINMESLSLMNLINDFRNLSGLDNKEMIPEEVRVVGLAKKVASSFEEELKSKKISIHWPENERVIRALPSLLSIALRNLIENSIRYGNGDIWFTIENPETPEETFVFSNKTNDKPLSQDIFLPFVSKNRKTSSGLGLTIVQKVISRHGGKTWASNEDGVFTISFTIGSL